jgi:hypothetical protein
MILNDGDDYNDVNDDVDDKGEGQGQNNVATYPFCMPFFVECV